MQNTTNKLKKSDINDIALNQQNNTFITVNQVTNNFHKLSKEQQNRLIDIMEKQTNHIIDIDNSFIDEFRKDNEVVRSLAPEQIKYMGKGQIMAFIITIMGLGLCGFLAYIECPWLAGFSLLGSLTALSAQFMDKDNKKNQDNKNKS